MHCITNAVAQNFTANVLLAAGAYPVDDDVAGGDRRLRRRADALLVNLGTFDAERREATEIAMRRPRGEDAALGARSGVRRPVAAARRFRARR